MDRHEEMVNELKRIMNTIDGRDFIYQFFLESCGVDFSEGIPSGRKDEYYSGVKKPAIDMFNLLVYNCYDKLILMINEQKNRKKEVHGE